MLDKYKARLNERILSIEPVKFFALVAAFFGLIFIAITPPFQTPDAQVHFFRSYQVSQLNFATDNVDGVMGGRLPVALDELITETTTDPVLAFYPQNKYDISNTLEQFDETIAGPTRVYDFSTTSIYGPVAYLPQAAGIGVARLFNLPPIAMMYLGRIGNLFAWIVLFSLAIRIMPIRKWVMVFIGLLPMALFQASSLSSDVVTLALSGLFIAYVFYLLNQSGDLGRKHFICLLGLGVALGLTKQLAFLLLPLVLAIPTGRFKDRRSNIIAKLILISVPLAIALAWVKIADGTGAVAEAAANGQDPARQLAFIVTSPHSYINALWNTYFFTWGDGVTRSLIGTFGWADTPLSEIIVVFGYLSLAALYLFSFEKHKSLFSRSQKRVVAGVVLLYALAISTALYLFYSPVAYKIVYGLQGRYFIPILMLLIPLLHGSWVSTSRAAYMRIAIFAPVLLLIASTITIYFRFYVNNV